MVHVEELQEQLQRLAAGRPVEPRLMDTLSAPRHRCPCCDNRTLNTRGLHEICSACRWEDDPTVDWNDVDAHSGPNRMSLSEAQRRFAARNRL